MLYLTKLDLFQTLVVLLFPIIIHRFRTSFLWDWHSIRVIALRVLTSLDEAFEIHVCELFQFELMLVDFVEHILDDPNIKIWRTVQFKYILLITIKNDHENVNITHDR
jgi:hypothetical protein